MQEPSQPPKNPPPSGKKPGLLHRLEDWWYPPTHVGLNRLQLTYIRSLRHWRKSALNQSWEKLLDRNYRWRHRLAHSNKKDPFEFLSNRLQKWLFRWQTAVLVLVLGCSFFAANHYGRPWYHRYRETHYAHQAEQYFTAGKFEQAVFRARVVLDLNNANLIANRVMADVSTLAYSSNALYWRKRVCELSPGFTNQMALAVTALQLERSPFHIASKTLNDIPPPERENKDYQHFAGILALNLSQLQSAEQHFSELVRLDPTNQVSRLTLAAVQLRSTNAAIRLSARGTLEKMVADPVMRLAALRPLAADSFDHQDFARAEQTSLQVLTNSQANFHDRITHLNILHQGRNQKLPAFLAESETVATNNPFAVLELASWMNAHGYARDALDWYPILPPTMAAQGTLPLTRACSYVVLRKWPELVRFLQRGSWVELDSLRFALLSLASVKQANAELDLAAWQSTLALAVASPDSLRQLAVLTGDWGWPDRKEQVLWLAAEKYPEQNWALIALNEICTRHNDTAGLCRIAKIVLDRNPQDKVAGNNYASYSFLLNQDLPRAHKLAASVYASSPSNAVCATTYAMSLLKQGRAKEALGAFQRIPPDQLEVPEIAAYFGITQTAAGEAAAARPYLKRSAQARLLPEELALVSLANKDRSDLMRALVPPPRPAPGTNALLPALVKNWGKDTTGLWRQAKVASLRNPADREAACKYALYSLLLGSDLPRAHKLAATLQPVCQTNSLYASACALSLLKQARPRDAVALLLKLPAQQLQSCPAAAYYGIALVAAGENASAQPYLKLALQNSLLAEEKALVLLAQNSALELANELKPPARPK